MRMSLVMFMILCASTWAFGGNVVAPYSGIGQCPSGQVVSGLNAHAPPTCVVGGGGGGIGVVNGVLNVKDPAFKAKGDCATDDVAAIQSAITAACGANSQQAVYLPPTLNSCYYITRPIQMNCQGLKVFGAGPAQTVLSKGFDGPTFVIQNTTSWHPPYLSSITAVWQPNHVFAQYAEIVDSNGNIEAATTGGTSANGAHPTWAGSQGGTTSDNTVTWTLESLGTQLLTGSGSAYDGLQYNGAFSQLGIPLDWSEAAWATSLNGLSQFSIEATVVPMTNAGGSDSVMAQSVIQPPFASSGLYAAFDFAIKQGTTEPEFFLTTSVGGIHFLTAPSNMSLGHSHHIAGTYDGTTMRLFVDGTVVASAAVTGTVVQTHSELVCGPCANGLSTFAIGALDGLRMSQTARYTSAFTPPTAKFTHDGNDLLLFNFVQSAVPGTQQGNDNIAATGNVFLPLEAFANCNSCQNGNVYLSDLGLNSNAHSSSGPGIWAAWSWNSRYANLTDNGATNGSDISIDLHDNDFQSRLDHVLVMAGGKFATEFSAAVNFGNQCSGCSAADVQVDGVNLITGFNSGNTSGDATNLRVVDRGNLVYAFLLGGGFSLVDPFLDSEGSSNNLTCDVVNAVGAFAPDTIVGGELDMSTTVGTAAYLCVQSGQPITATGTFFGGNAGTLLNVLFAPAAPVVVRDAKFGSIARTNASNGQYLSIQQNGTPEQSTNANLWFCGAVDLGSQVLVTDNDSACSFGGTPSHTSCTIGTNCFACLAKCQVSGATAYAWKE